MGSKKQKREKFLAEHPICCFCGGGSEAEEPDHIPSRAIFDDRQWPEGFEFPACVRCNRATRYDEEIVAFISRLYPDPAGAKRTEDFKKICETLERYRPDVMEEIRGTANQKKKALKENNIALEPGQAAGNAPLIRVGPLVNEAVTNFSRKLILALYYQQTGTILNHDAGIAIRWFSNLEVAQGKLPAELAQYIRGYPDIVRCNTSLKDQFSYGYTFSDCGRLSIFLVFFRRSFTIVGAVNLDSDKFDLPDIAKILKPYNHQSAA
ncbi:hypothetical protein [Pseudohongiella spirulinae]|uniref:Uncharacterized protein n=1 Tax=Pseudohongiella spirulinae TaxID=1249552 RepID=A0A0S2K9J1_9GAMM|nr:hypothetical protein [Pseudohongiella spirulinae]ALO44889.1 hypothetical protein PS2015_195 [Pseudohongiella spirulinae]